MAKIVKTFPKLCPYKGCDEVRELACAASNELIQVVQAALVWFLDKPYTIHSKVPSDKKLALLCKQFINRNQAVIPRMR